METRALVLAFELRFRLNLHPERLRGGQRRSTFPCHDSSFPSSASWTDGRYTLTEDHSSLRPQLDDCSSSDDRNRHIHLYKERLAYLEGQENVDIDLLVVAGRCYILPRQS